MQRAPQFDTAYNALSAATYSDIAGSSDVWDCIDCQAGRYSETTGSDDEYDCIDCVAGKYSDTVGSSQECSACPVGSATNTGIGDGASECTLCLPGTYSAIEACGSSVVATGCEPCEVGEYSAGNTSTCASCVAVGLIDHDANPATPCIAAGDEVCTQNCTAGTEDSDCDIDTPCVACASGEYTDGVGQYPDVRCLSCPAGQSDHDAQPETPCETCSPGFYAGFGHAMPCDACEGGRFGAMSGGTSIEACQECQIGQFSTASSATCDFCSSGRADDDSDPATDCVDCEAGTFAGCGETACTECVEGQTDSDENAATPCTACLAGQYWEAATEDSTSQCIECPAGKADSDSDSPAGCVDCAVGEYCAEGTVVPVLCADTGSIDDDDDPTTPCVTGVEGTAVAIDAEVTLDLDIEILSNPSSRANFDELFKADMATLLGIDASRVQVSGVSGGSVVVTFMILPAADGTSFATADLEAAFNSGAVSLAGADASSLSATTSTVDLAACLQVCLPGF